MTVIGMDFETYGTRALPKVGLDNYFADPEFTPLLVALHWQRGNATHVETFDLHPKMPRGDQTILFLELLDSLAQKGVIIAAHNCAFEEQVMEWIYSWYPDWEYLKNGLQYVDTAVLSRTNGGTSHLVHAAHQFLPFDKMEEGARLIKVFSMPDKQGNFPFNDPDFLKDHIDDWKSFVQYCIMDARASWSLHSELARRVFFDKENRYARLTREMNRTGWKVDLDLVEAMRVQVERNKTGLLDAFRSEFDQKGELNVRSHVQLVKWCANRGVRAKSFDELNVKKLLSSVSKKLNARPNKLTTDQTTDLYEVEALLMLKQQIGGSSVSKLDAIIERTSEDGILRDQYMHAGAGQSFRTTGKGVQMQNLKRLNTSQEFISSDLQYWDNEQLAANIRQCFTSRWADGELIVGDYSSIEARGLAWVAGAEWKLDAFRQGKDIYEVQARDMYHIPGDGLVTKEERDSGKTGELSCGYGAGGSAVQAFAERRGILMTEAEATELVSNWRGTNVEIVAFWRLMDDMLRQAVTTGYSQLEHLSNGFTVSLFLQASLESMHKQNPNSRGTLVMRLDYPDGTPVLERRFVGVYMDGRDILYHKPSELKTGPVWKDGYMDPKTKQFRKYNLYGGKLTGILVQSFCREIFFQALDSIRYNQIKNVLLCGQFHDEIILDWTASAGLPSADYARSYLASHMRHAGQRFPGLPIDVEVKSAFRYTK